MAFSKQSEQSEQREQREQPEQPEQAEQSEQREQPEQSEQPEQLIVSLQFFRLSSAACAASFEPKYSTEHRLPLLSSSQIIGLVCVLSRATGSIEQYFLWPYQYFRCSQPTIRRS